MFADILVWAVYNPAQSNLMVVSKTISQETLELSSLLHDLESKGYNIFIAHAEHATPPMLPPASFEWHLDTLLLEGNLSTEPTTRETNSIRFRIISLVGGWRAMIIQ